MPSESSEEEMTNPIHNPTLKQLVASVLDQQPLYIQLPETGSGFELKSRLIPLLLKLNMLSGEDPNKYLTKFLIVCPSIKRARVIEEQIALKAFPFSLPDPVKECLYYLPYG